MPLIVNLRHIEHENKVYEGELTVEELDFVDTDDLLRTTSALTFHVEASRQEHNLLVRGVLRVRLECTCVRCLKPFETEVAIEDWARMVTLAGEESVPVVNDTVDLTSLVREDALLEFPRHPLCETECGGLLSRPSSVRSEAPGDRQKVDAGSTWAALDRLKLKP